LRAVHGAVDRGRRAGEAFRADRRIRGRMAGGQLRHARLQVSGVDAVLCDRSFEASDGTVVSALLAALDRMWGDGGISRTSPDRAGPKKGRADADFGAGRGLAGAVWRDVPPLSLDRQLRGVLVGHRAPALGAAGGDARLQPDQPADCGGSAGAVGADPEARKGCRALIHASAASGSESTATSRHQKSQAPILCMSARLIAFSATEIPASPNTASAASLRGTCAS